MITSFPERTEQNIGGMFTFKFIQSRYVTSIPPWLNDTITDLVGYGVPIGEEAWKDGYSSMESLKWSEDAVGDPNRPKYKQELVGFCPEFNPVLEKLFAEMVREGRFVLDCFDNQNRRILAGTISNGMHFEYKFTTGEQAKKRKGYAFRFFRDCDEPAPFYEPPSFVS